MSKFPTPAVSRCEVWRTRRGDHKLDLSAPTPLGNWQQGVDCSAQGPGGLLKTSTPTQGWEKNSVPYFVCCQMIPLCYQLRHNLSSQSAVTSWDLSITWADSKSTVVHNQEILEIPISENEIGKKNAHLPREQESSSLMTSQLHPSWRRCHARGSTHVVWLRPHSSTR